MSYFKNYTNVGKLNSKARGEDGIGFFGVQTSLKSNDKVEI
jgi:hypothetical protein